MAFFIVKAAPVIAPKAAMTAVCIERAVLVMEAAAAEKAACELEMPRSKERVSRSIRT